MNSEEILTQQSDEIEALSAIYGEEWCVVDDNSKIYCIQVTDGQDKPSWALSFQVHLPVDYPSEAPPEYQLNAPWLRGDERQVLEAALADIYCDNLGESIIYLWVEKIRDFLQEKSSEAPSESPNKRRVQVSTETDHGDDDLDLSALQIETLNAHLTDHADTGDDWECPPITHGDVITDRRSTFQPHFAPVFHRKQIKLVMDKLYENKKIANATHNIMAYRILQNDSNSIVCQGCDDDGETHAGSRMLHLLQILDAENVLVVVSRWYGGILLGPDRFKHINNCTRAILEKTGHIKEKDGKKGPKSSSDKKKR